MSLAERIRARYLSEMRRVGEMVTIRRYYGTGSPRSKYEKACLARVNAYAADELIGGIVQGDQKVILLAEDMETGAVTLPLLISDKVVVRGRELQIVSIDANTRRVAGVLCAYEMQVRG